MVRKGDLQRWLAGRIGYGSLRADWWFLGMEEACEDSDAELSARLSGELLEDFLGGHRKLFPRCRNLFEAPVKAQPTLRPLIKTLLAAAGRSCDLSQIKDYQAKSWARTGGETLQTELMPLPAPSAAAWPNYYVASGLPELATRAMYEAHWRPRRMELLRRLVSEHQPKVLVCYGKHHWPAYMALVDPAATWEEVPAPVCFHAVYAILPGPLKRIAVLTPHTTVRGARNHDWIALGRFIGASAPFR